MSSVHLARQGFITKATLPSVSRERGTTTVADNRTVLLLNGNGTNGKQNNTFVTENFGSAGGQGNYSVFFDGTGDSVRTPTSAAVLGTNNWTFECWVYLNAKPSFGQVLGMRKGVATSADQYAPVVIAINSTGFLLYSSSNSSSWNVANGTTFGGTANTNEWYHVAVVRDGSTIYGFLNGVRTTLVTGVSADYTSTNSIFVGGAESTDAVNCYVSNARVVNGTAVYTSAFTPPTSELTAISNTSLLTCQGTVIRDASSNNFAITVNGDAKVASNTSSAPIAITRNGNATQGSFSPFTLPDGQWSNFFDGTGDFLSITPNSSMTLDGDFTIETWVYFTALDTAERIPVNCWNSGQGWLISTQSNAWNFKSSSFTLSYSAVAPTTNTWYHIAVTRSGSSTNNVKMFINGAQVAQGTYTGTMTPASSSTGCVIGGGAGGTGQLITGYVSNVRIVKGTAVYTSAFTPPTNGLTAISGTSLLTCQSNRFRDASSNNFAITRNGDVRVTPWSPFAPTSAYDPATNGGSGYFDGTGDAVTFTNTDYTGDFTFECWVYPLSTADQIIAGSNGNFVGANTQIFRLNETTAGNLSYYGGGNSVVLSAGITPNRWHHLVMSRTSGTLQTFVNGTRIDSRTYTNTFKLGSVGALVNPTVANSVNGYISNFRAINGTGIYSGTTITVPTAPVTNITNTSLLLNFTNAGIFDTAGDNVIETVGNAQIDTTIKKYGSGSLEFDGTGDYLLCYSPRLLPSGREPFTIEAWIYLTNSVTSTQVIVSWGTRNNNQFCGFTVKNNTLEFYNWFNDLATSNLGLSTNTWYHVAAQYDGTTKRIFFNGVQVASATTTTVNIATTDRATVGAQDGDFAALLTGYIDDLRITKGVAKYTAAGFTPPTSELVVVGTVPNIVTNSTYGVYQLA